jgi:hypothetical protein
LAGVKSSFRAANVGRNPEQETAPMRLTSLSALLTAAVFYCQPAQAQQSGDILYSAAELPAQIATLGNDLGCELDEAMQAWGAKELSWDEGSAIYLVPCHNADINVESIVAWNYMPGDEIGHMRFDALPGEGDGLRDTIINPSYDPDTSELSATTYSSADGDCGTFEKHRYNEAENRFELLEVRVKDNCDGVPTIPSEYPLSWSRN